jgi:RNA polymerase sigma factor (sigma-70 family)
MLQLTDVQSNYMRRTDKELLIACRNGDETSWQVLVDRYQRLLYTIPRRAGLDQDQASEVFQDVFVTLLEKIDDINDPDRLHAWLVTAARRKTWRLITKQRSSRGVDSIDAGDDEDSLAVIADENPLPDEVLLRLEEQHRVRTAVAALGERCQKLLTMLYYEHEPPSYAEIAAAFGTSEGSIGPTRARCLKKLLHLLEE